METADQVWKVFGDRLRRFIRLRVRSDHDAEDLVQEVFSKIHSGLGSLRENGKLEAWLFQVTRRAIVDFYRTRSQDRRPEPLPVDLARKDPPPEVAAEIASWLRPMMEELPEPDRRALHLADIEGLPLKDLAVRLGLSLSGAKSRVQRSRGRLKQILLDCCHVEMDRRGRAIGYTPRRGNCNSCGPAPESLRPSCSGSVNPGRLEDS